MKRYFANIHPQTKDNTQSILIIGTLILILQVSAHFTVWAHPPTYKFITEDSVKIQLNEQLNSEGILKQLNFPNTVKRFYANTNGETQWLAHARNIGPTASAMLLLDCVRQFGLKHQDYHPEILTYTQMYNATSSQNSTPLAEKIEFELMLTDAMITIINHLHYGAYNPELTSTVLDNGLPDRLRSEDFLLSALHAHDLMDTIITVQPQTEQYKQLQGYMKLIAGQYLCDAYETPEHKIRILAANLERLRWVNVTGNTYLHINIPSFELLCQQENITKPFKVVIGKTNTPTPTLQSNLYLIETAPDWNVPSKIFIKELLPKAVKDHAFFEKNHMQVYSTKEKAIPIDKLTLAAIKANPKEYHLRQSSGCDNALGKVVFRFNNSFGIDLHDTPQQDDFKKQKRALSHGCIRVENAGNLAQILLTQDHKEEELDVLATAMKTYSRKQFQLARPIPIIITYLTLTVKNGLLISHDDIYQLDEILVNKMYGPKDQLTKNGQQ